MESKNLSGKSKLRGTEKSFLSSWVRPQSNSDLINSTEDTFNSLSIAEEQNAAQNYSSMSYYNPGPHQRKSAGRGIFIQQISQSLNNSKDVSRKTDLDFSNSNIERYFKTQREKNKIKFEEDNKKKWESMLNSNKHS